MPGGNRSSLTVGLPIAKRAMGWFRCGAFADLRMGMGRIMRGKANAYGACLGVRGMHITGRVRMRDHAERAKEHVQQGYESGLRAGRYEVVERALEQLYACR